MKLLGIETCDNFLEILGMEKTIWTPPELLDDLKFEETLQILLIGLLPKGVLEELGYLGRLNLYHLGDFLGLCVVNEKHEDVLVFNVILRVDSWIDLLEKHLGILPESLGDPVVVLSTELCLELVLKERTECSQNLLDEYICFDSLRRLKGHINR